MCIAPWPRWSTIRDWIGSQPHSTGCDSEAANRFCRRDDSRTDQQKLLDGAETARETHRFVVRLGRLRRLGGPAQFLLVREEAAVVRPAVAGAAQRGNLSRRELAVSCTRNIRS